MGGSRQAPTGRTGVRDDAHVLAERARALAGREQPGATDVLPTLAFDAGAERYAVPVEAVLRVERIGAVARVPGAPRGTVGLVNLHGRSCVLVDVPSLLGVPGADPSGRQWALVLGGPVAGATARGCTVALAADAVRLEPVPRERLARPEGPRLGVTADARVVLDPSALLDPPRTEGAP
jgi:chemotaxis signal transduction protein